MTEKKKRWIDLAEHGIFLGDQKMGDGKFRLILLDMNEISDPTKLKEINFVPVKTSPRYSKGVYFLNTDDQQLRPKALASALGIASCPLVDVDPVEIDKLFREKLKERFNVTLNTITQQSLPLGFNKDGHRVYDTSVGRMVRVTPENALLEGSAQAAKISSGIFLRAKTDNDLNECAEGFMQHILQGEKTNWSDVTKFAKAIFEYDDAPSNLQLRKLQETIEAAAYRHFALSVVEPSRDSFVEAQNIYFSLPVSQMRSSESIALQQYSTPLPMAVIAQRLLIGHDDITGKSVLEPTAGNGGLINALPSDKVSIHAIEYDKQRVEQLSRLPGVNVQFGDATAINYKNYLDVPEGFDYTIVNPPFGKMDIKRDFSVLKDVAKLDHFIPLRSLESRKDHGRSVFIIGADSNHSTGEVASNSTQEFFNYLYDHYEVHGTTEIDGRLYARQGANYNVRMIVVGDKRDKIVEQDVPRKFNVISTYEELWQWSENIIAQYTALDESKRKKLAIDADEIVVDYPVGISADFGFSQQALFDADEKSVINNQINDAGNNDEATGTIGNKKYKPTLLPDVGNDDVSDEIEPVNQGFATPDERAQELDRRTQFVSKSLVSAKYNSVDDHTFDGKNIRIAFDIVTPKNGNESFANYVVTDRRNNMVFDVVDALKTDLKVVTEELRQRVKELNFLYENQQETEVIQSKQEMAAPEVSQRNINEFQVPYQAASKVGEPTTMIPINMAGSTYAALNALEREVGGVDAYVGSKLEYEPEELARYFSPEQVDALALSIYAAENNRGIINADQTGIGKGRWVAAMMRYAHINSMTPMFTTIKPELFTDIFRDIKDIGSLDRFKKVFIFNSGEDIKKYGTADEVLFKATSPAELAKAITEGRIEDDVDMVLSTYSQFQRAQEVNPKAALLTKIARNNGMLFLDESHVAAGASNISMTVGTAVANATAVMYGSATPLKGVSNFAIYNKIFPESVDLKSLPDTLKTGGEALQEAISANMAKDGVIVRREHDFSKLTFHTREPSEERTQHNRDVADALAEITAELSYMSGDVSEIVSSLNDDFKDNWEVIPERDRQGNRMQASSMNFGSRLHSINRQFLLGIKIDEAIDAALLALEEGRKPVIAVENTGESLLRQVVARRAGIDELQSELDEIDESDNKASLAPDVKARRGELVQKINEAMRGVILEEPPQFRELLEIMLDRVGTIKVHGRYGGVEIKRPESEEYELQEMRVRDLIKNFPDMPLTPIDVIHTALERRGHPCAEVSGRTVSLKYHGETNALGEHKDAGWGLKFHPKADAVANVAGFQNGTFDAITITRSGSTGISLHATDRFDDSDIRQRDFIVLQKAQNIAEFLQWLGRVNRKDQVSFPVITSLESGLPAELRLTMMHNTKLRKLSANTTSNRSNANAEGDMDLLNDVGDRVALQWLVENPDIADRLDIKLPSGDEEDMARFSSDNMYINKLLGRLMMVNVEQQEKIIGTISSRFAEYVEELEQRGANPFKVNVYEWNAEVVAVEELQTGVIRSTSSTFDEPVKLVTIRHEEDVYPVRSGRLNEMIKAGREAFISSGVADKNGSLEGYINRLKSEQDAYIRSQLPQKIRVASEDIALRRVMEENKDNIAGAKRAKERSDWLIQQLPHYMPGMSVKYDNPFAGMQSGFIAKVGFPQSEDDLFLLSHYEISAVFPGETTSRHLTLATILAQGNELSPFPFINPERFESEPWAKREAERLLAAYDKVPDGKVERKHYLLEGNLFRACELAATESLGAPILYTDVNGDRQRAVLLRDWISPEQVKALPIGLDAGDMVDYIKEYFARGRDWSHRSKETRDGGVPPLHIFDSSVKEMKPGDGISILSRDGRQFVVTMPGTKTRAGALLTDGHIFNIGQKTPSNSLRLELSGDKKVMSATIPATKIADFLSLMQLNGHAGKLFLPQPEMPIIDLLKARYLEGVKVKNVDKSMDNG